MEAVNYVAQLNELAQRRRAVLCFEDAGCVGPDHIKTFTLRAVLNGKAYPDGVGKNKKEAKQNAAKNALRGLFEETADITEDTAETSTASVYLTSTSILNYVSWLNEYGQKNRVTVKTVESTKLGPNNTIQCCSFVVGDKEYPAAYGNTRKEAKEEAAKLVYQEIFSIKTTETGDEKPVQEKEESKQNVSDVSDRLKMLNVKTEDKRFAETNFKQIINLYCQKAKHSHDYIFERRCGPSHNPQFFYKLVIDNTEYPVGEGKSVKEAQQNAAQMAWSAIQKQSDGHSKETLWPDVSSQSVASRLSIPSSTPEPHEAKSQSMLASTSDSVIFTHSANPPEVQDQNLDMKPKIKIAANFQNATRQRKEDIQISDCKDKNQGRSRSEKQTTQSAMSRFTSEFDSIERLGKGAFGRVFRARQKLLKRFYAVKIVRCKEKALREVMALSDLHHTNIVRYFTCWMEDSEYQWDITADGSSTSQSTNNSKYIYIQMELCDTMTLRVWIDEKNTQNVKKSLRNTRRREDSLTIAQQIVSGVEYIHSKKLIHRDLKPANIMFGRDGEVKIGDFGLVTAEIDDDAENLLERTVYKGTPSYMAPEQRSRNTYDRKVDIYALGLIYFELLWNLSTGPEKKVMWDEVRNRTLPQGFSHNFPQESQIIKSMLCLKPEDRPDASKLKTELEECAHAFHALKNSSRDSKSV